MITYIFIFLKGEGYFTNIGHSVDWFRPFIFFSLKIHGTENDFISPLGDTTSSKLSSLPLSYQISAINTNCNNSV